MTTHIQDTLTVSLPRMEGNRIAYSLLHNDTIVGNISQSKDGNHQVTVGISSYTGTFKSCVDWAKTNFLTSRQPLATMDSQASPEVEQMSTQAPAIEFPGQSFLRVPSNQPVPFKHPHLQRFNGLQLPQLPEDLKCYDISEDEIAQMSYQDLDDAVFILEDEGFDHQNPWNIIYATYRNAANFRRMDAIDAAKATQETPMSTIESTDEPTEYGVTELSPLELAVATDDARQMIEKMVWESNTKYDLVDPLVEAIADYIATDSQSAYKTLQTLAQRAKWVGIFKRIGQLKNSPEFKALENANTPTLEVSGGNERGTVVAVGTTATEVANAPKPPKASKGTKGTKAPKKTKTLPALPVITDLAALEALDRKALQSAMSITNLHKVTGVKGNGKTVDILKALAKHLLGIDDYTPVAKPTIAKGSSKGKDEVPLEIPQGLCWDEVKGMKYRQLQSLCKVFRSNGLYQGNLAGKGVTSEHLLKSAAAAMRALGHDIVEVSVPAQDPDNLLALAK